MTATLTIGDELMLMRGYADTTGGSIITHEEVASDTGLPRRRAKAKRRRCV